MSASEAMTWVAMVHAVGSTSTDTMATGVLRNSRPNATP
jgi:hypothetical protein